VQSLPRLDELARQQRGAAVDEDVVFVDVVADCVVAGTTLT